MLFPELLDIDELGEDIKGEEFAVIFNYQVALAKLGNLRVSSTMVEVENT